MKYQYGEFWMLTFHIYLVETHTNRTQVVGGEMESIKFISQKDEKKYFIIALMDFLCAAFIYMGIGRQSYNYAGSG